MLVRGIFFTFCLLVYADETVVSSDLSSIAYSVKNEISLSAQLKEAQLALIKQSFLCVKPENDSLLSSHEAVQKFIKQ